MAVSAAEQPVTSDRGLTDSEVRERLERGQANRASEQTSRTLSQILRANVLTRFNAILGTMLVLVLIFGAPQDALFGIVLVVNSLIGIVQELRAKRTLDRLAVLNAPRARAVREGTVQAIAVDDVVLDDLLELRSGDQLPADGVVRGSAGLEVDESLLTGEADPIAKDAGDEVLSGSIVVAGSGRFQATRVGPDAYARRLATEARRFTRAYSELVAGIDRLLLYITWGIVVVGPLLLWSQLRSDSLDSAMVATVAGVVGMVPEGLVLLTSLAFLIAAVTLARRQVLVQELPAVEGLARVDVLCLDKTGTLTEGSVQFERLELLEEPQADETADAALGALAADEDRNATMAAIAAAFDPPAGWRRTGAVAFSSARKWSAAMFDGHGSWVIGAPEMVWLERDAVRDQADEAAATGSRTLLLARADAPLDGDRLPSGLRPLALVLLQEQIRPDAAETLEYFRVQGVALKVISGDNPRTVGAVARRVQLPDRETAPVDARTLPEDPEVLGDVLDAHSVFGRVTPQQKRQMVAGLQARGHTVAMTGDGVNDALALKDADIGIAMGSGAPAARAVAQIVLLDGRFATLPGVVAEGRRVTANIERVATLFLTKTTYAMLLAFAIAVANWPYPFLPRHLTLVSTLTIGVPAFFLALAPSLRRYKPGFVRRVLRLAIPAGFIASSFVFAAYGLARVQGAHPSQAKTTATIVLTIVALWVLAILARPWNWWRGLLVATMAGAFVLVLVVPPLRDFYALSLPSNKVLVEALAFAGAGCGLVEIAFRIAARLGPRDQPDRPPEPARRT